MTNPERAPSFDRRPEDYCLEHVTLHSPLPLEPIGSERRKREDVAVLQAFWATEAAMGFPLNDAAKDHQVKLMAMSGCVPTQGHRITRAGAARQRVAAEAKAAAKEAGVALPKVERRVAPVPPTIREVRDAEAVAAKRAAEERAKPQASGDGQKGRAA